MQSKSMKKYPLYTCLLLCIAWLMACSKDESNNLIDTWKTQNEQAFKQMGNDPTFTLLESPGNNGSLYYRVVKKGNGKRIYYNSRAEVYYKGWFVADNAELKIKKGSLFDQRLLDDGVPFRVAMHNDAANASSTNPQGYAVPQILGWRIALQHMVEGDIWEIHIPSELAYGKNGDRTIPGYTTLAFEIEVVKAFSRNEF